MDGGDRGTQLTDHTDVGDCGTQLTDHMDRGDCGTQLTDHMDVGSSVRIYRRKYNREEKQQQKGGLGWVGRGKEKHKFLD